MEKYYGKNKSLISKKEYECNANVSVPRKLMGQCIAINEDGKYVQDGISGEMNIMFNNTPKYLILFINPFGTDETGGIGIYSAKIWREEYGKHSYDLEKITINRLPYPYSKPPSCVVQRSDEAESKIVFKGPYTMTKCKQTCRAYDQMTRGGMQNKFRVHVKDRKTHQKLENHRRLRKEINLAKCLAECQPPCEEVNYRVTERYKKFGGKIRIYFKLNNMETLIEEVPSYGIENLLANFGGTLGLMTGMSAISIIEMTVWLVLFIIGRVLFVYSKLTGRPETK